MVKYDLMCEVGWVCEYAHHAESRVKKKKKSPRGGPIIDPAWAGQGMGMACQGRKGGKDRDAS